MATARYNLKRRNVLLFALILLGCIVATMRSSAGESSVSDDGGTLRDVAQIDQPQRREELEFDAGHRLRRRKHATTTTTGVLFLFDPMHECTPRELQRIEILVGPSVLVSVVAFNSTRHGPMHVSMDALSGAAMLHELLRQLRRTSSPCGNAAAAGCAYVALDYHRANLFCASPFPRMHAAIAAATQRRRRQGHVLFYAQMPIPVDDAAEVHQAFRRIEALYVRNASADALSRLHATLFLTPTPSIAAQAPPRHRTMASSSFIGGDRHALELFLSEVINAIRASNIRSGISIEPLFSNHIASWVDGRPHGVDVTMLAAFPCMDELRRMTRRNDVTLHTACHRFTSSSSEGALVAPFLVVDTTPQCLGRYRLLLHDMGSNSNGRPLDASSPSLLGAAATAGNTTTTATYVDDRFPTTAADSIKEEERPLQCTPTFLFGRTADRNGGALALDLNADNTAAAAVDLPNVWKAWQRDNDGGKWNVPHALLVPTLGSVRRTVGRDRLLPPRPCADCSAAQGAITVVVTMAARYAPDRIAGFVETFLAAHSPPCDCSRGLVILVALVTDPTACEAAFLRPKSGQLATAPTPPANVVFLPVAPWKKLSGSATLKRCKVVVSRFPVLLLLLRVVQDEWHPTYAMITDARDVLFQSHVGSAMHTHLVTSPAALIASIAWTDNDTQPDCVQPSSHDRPRYASDNVTSSTFAVVAERTFLGSVHVHRSVPYIFNRMWLASTYGDGFAERVVGDARLSIVELEEATGSNGSTAAGYEGAQHRHCTRRRTASMPLPVVCAGLMIGTTGAVIDAVRLLIATMSTGTKCSSNDQGALLGLVVAGFAASRFPHRVVLLDPHTSLFTHGYEDGGRTVVLDATSGQMLNCRGERYALLHQMDRLDTELSGRLLHHLRLFGKNSS